MQVKVCGLSTAEQVETCIEYGANFCGFILNYKKSHRFVNYQTVDQLTKINKKNTAYVGVFVNPTIDELKAFSNLNLDYFQIYGDYSNAEIAQFKNKTSKKIPEELLSHAQVECINQVILIMTVLMKTEETKKLTVNKQPHWLKYKR